MPTGKSHGVKKKGVPIYDINTKAAGVMIHAGLSGNGLRKFMAGVEVPPASMSALKKGKKSRSKF